MVQVLCRLPDPQVEGNCEFRQCYQSKGIPYTRPRHRCAACGNLVTRTEIPRETCPPKTETLTSDVKTRKKQWATSSQDAKATVGKKRPSVPGKRLRRLFLSRICDSYAAPSKGGTRQNPVTKEPKWAACQDFEDLSRRCIGVSDSLMRSEPYASFSVVLA